MSTNLLFSILAAGALTGVLAGCGSTPDPAPAPSAQPGTSQPAQPGSGPSFKMPDGWPLPEFPLPNGASAGTTTRSDDQVVAFRLEGTDYDTAKKFYTEKLPGLGYADRHNANLAIAVFQGNGLEISVQDDTDLGVPKIMIKKAA